MAIRYIPPLRRRLDPVAEDQRHTLHEATMNDAAIGRMVGRDRSTIRLWRVTRGLPSHCPWFGHPPGRPATSEEIAAFVKLYDAGRNDSEIGRLLGRSRRTIRDWRVSRKLPANAYSTTRTAPPEYLHILISMHGEGRSDGEIAAKVGRDRSTISFWRRRLKLPSNRPVGSGSVDPRFARSLDAPLFEEGGQLHDLIPDLSQSEWLEEMGATVW